MVVKVRNLRATSISHSVDDDMYSVVTKASWCLLSAYSCLASCQTQSVFSPSSSHFSSSHSCGASTKHSSSSLAWKNAYSTSAKYAQYPGFLASSKSRIREVLDELVTPKISFRWGYCHLNSRATNLDRMIHSPFLNLRTSSHLVVTYFPLAWDRDIAT